MKTGGGKELFLIQEKVCTNKMQLKAADTGALFSFEEQE